jgi:hypothetical protein
MLASSSSVRASGATAGRATRAPRATRRVASSSARPGRRRARSSVDRAHRPGPNTSSSSSVVVAAGPTPAATFELAVDAARAGAISLDDPASLFGPVGSLVAVAYIARVVWTGTETIKRLKAELTAEGYDVDEFNKVGELKAIRNAVDNGTVDGIYDKVWYNRLVMSAGAGSITDVQKAKAYWRKRGVTVNTLADMDKVTKYMEKKYGKSAKMNK